MAKNNLYRNKDTKSRLLMRVEKDKLAISVMKRGS